MPDKKSEPNQASNVKRASARLAPLFDKLVPSNDLGTKSSAGGRAGQAEPTYPLTLTKLDRDCLSAQSFNDDNIARLLRKEGDGAQNIELTCDELRELSRRIANLILNTEGARRKRLRALELKVTTLLATFAADPDSAEAPGILDRAPEVGPLIYQFKITLMDIEPAIWRRIRVSNCTLGDLHYYIQAAFGWEDCHEHIFHIGRRSFGPEDLYDCFDIDARDEDEITLDRLISKAGKPARWQYDYDFGDDWTHEVNFEGFAPSLARFKVPFCVDGRRACPPEECGGPCEYEQLVEAITDPDHEFHETVLENYGPFNPEEFDAKQATKEMRRLK